MDKKLSCIAIAGATLISSTESAQAEHFTTLDDLASSGLNSRLLAEKFHEAQVDIDWNETLKLRAEDEGKNIHLETLDRFSIVVPIESAVGNPNKIDPDLID